jgi:hypothetical protein
MFEGRTCVFVLLMVLARFDWCAAAESGENAARLGPVGAPGWSVGRIHRQQAHYRDRSRSVVSRCLPSR